MVHYLEVAYDDVIPICNSILLHPLVYARNMMMVGYEPDPPTLRPVLYTLIDKNFRRHVYPNVFRYLGRLREEIGLFQLFTTGLPASIVGSYLKKIASGNVMSYFATPTFKKSLYVTNQGVRVFAIETSKLTAARVLGVIVSYPLQVVMIRQMAEFTGCDGSYGNVFLAIPRIIKNEGIMSLFNGMIPQILGEIFTAWFVGCCIYALNRYVFTDETDPSLKQITPAVCSMMVSSSTHPLTVTSAVMSISGSKLHIGLPFQHWWDCYMYLYQRGYLNRGSSLFFRYAPPTFVL